MCHGESQEEGQEESQEEIVLALPNTASERNLTRRLLFNTARSSRAVLFSDPMISLGAQ
jgi:hypothetical protein